MVHYFLQSKNIFGDNAVFDEKESSHLMRVLKKQKGDAIEAFDENGLSYALRISDCSNPLKVCAAIVGKSQTQKIELPKLILCPALIKLPRFELLLEKAAELGVAAIAPILTRRSIIEISEKQVPAKLERWNKIVLAACKQCDRTDFPKIFAPKKLNDCLTGLQQQNAQRIFLWEGEKQNFFNAQRLSSFDSEKETYLLTGPEGGFAPEEAELARKTQAHILGLRTHILRAETAAIAASSLFLIR